MNIKPITKILSLKSAAPLAAVLIIGLAASAASAQTGADLELKFASTPNPVGSGGRAVGWASAFIAVSDDATAASWNPAGLVQLLTPETSVVLSYHNRLETVDFPGLKSDSETASIAGAKFNYASIVYPFHVGNLNMVASLNYQRLYEFDRDLEYTTVGIREGATLETSKLRLQQAGALTTLTPAFAVQILPQWSLGVAVNIWGLEPAGNGWEQSWQQTTTLSNPNYPGLITKQVWVTRDQDFELSGMNFVIGTHYKIQNLTIGAVYKSGWEADVKYTDQFEWAWYDYQNPQTSAYQRNPKQHSDETIVWPESYGIGLAYRYSDRLSFALDAYTTRWSQFKQRAPGKDLNLMSGSDQKADTQDTIQVRGGAEYLWIMPKYVFALRGGMFYDPEPFEGSVNEFYGLALGGGWVYKNMVLDAAVQYRWGNNVKAERSQNVRSETDAQDIFAVVSLIYYFPGLALN